MKILVITGTRPEVLKLAPVVRAMEEVEGLEPVVCATGQHREMLDLAMETFGLRPQLDLRVMVPAQRPEHVMAAVMAGLAPVIAREQPAWVVVQGDTTSAFAGAFAAFHQGVPVAHVEAGLRSHRLDSPWPEEANRRLIADLASLHFAPTAGARDNLLAEGIPADCIHVTGNTAVDALRQGVQRLREPRLRRRLGQAFSWLDPASRLVLVTGHRRENLPHGLRGLCRAVRQLAARDDVQVAFPVHLNPAVREVVHEVCGGLSRVRLLEPLDYLSFVYLLERCHLVITDSGGIQEEAPSLEKPVLVTRAVTERPEGLAAGVARLVGSEPGDIVAAASELLDSPVAYRAMTGRPNPFGDGRAGVRIAALLAAQMGLREVASA